MFDSSSSKTPELLGALAFYLRDANVLPEAQTTVSKLSAFSQIIGEAIRKHKQKIYKTTEKPLSLVWETDLENDEVERTRRDKNYRGLLVGDLTLNLAKGSVKHLDHITSSVMKRLEGSQYYCVIKHSPVDTTTIRTLLVAGHEGIEPEVLRATVLSAAGHACEGGKYISYRFTLRRNSR